MTSHSKPLHYQGKNMEVFDVLEAFLTKNELEGFFKGNVIKYVLRYPYKDGRNDLIKARHYLNKLVELHDASF